MKPDQAMGFKHIKEEKRVEVLSCGVGIGQGNSAWGDLNSSRIILKSKKVARFYSRKSSKSHYLDAWTDSVLYSEKNFDILL